MKKPIGAPTNEPRETYAADDSDHEKIAIRAYELWIGRGCPIGSPEIDWLQAEAEISESPEAATMHLQAA